MTTLIITRKSDPVYNEYGYLIGYDTIDKKELTLTSEEAEELINQSIGNEDISIEIKTN